MWLFLTLAFVLIVVAGLAGYLLSVAFALVQARRDVAGIADALEAVARHVAPLEERLATVNGAMSAIAEGLEAADGHLARAATVFRL